MPSILNDTSLLRQDLNEPLGLTLIEHHASNCGDQRLVGEVERTVSVQGPCADRRIRDLHIDKNNQTCPTPKQQEPVRAKHSVQLPGVYGSLTYDGFISQQTHHKLKISKSKMHLVHRTY